MCRARPILGTGTTALAAEKHGRDWIDIEPNPKYAEMSMERLRAERAKRQPRKAA